MTEKSKPRLILGSSSPQRIGLLQQIGITPEVIKPADIDETPRKGELPDPYCLRMALEKNAALATEFPNDFILTGDTTVAVGRRIFGKSENEAEQEKFLRLISGRSHRVISAVALRDPNSKVAHRISVSRLTIKRLSENEIKSYLIKGEWKGIAGCKYQHGFAPYVSRISGSPSGIIGLPLYETMQLLNGLGYKTDTENDNN